MYQHGDPNLLEGLRPPHSRGPNGLYGRMFRGLQPHVPRLTAAKLRALRQARTDPERSFEMSPGTGNVRSGARAPAPRPREASDPEVAIELLAQKLVSRSEEHHDNERIPAGYTFLGQFITHDLTFDPTSVQQRAGDPDRMQNFRTPRLDLDLVYGNGPRVSPYHYGVETAHRGGPPGVDPAREATLRDYRLHIDRDPDTGEEDLPRVSSARAVIPDPRNDSHLIISQLHLAFLKFHNRALEHAVDTLGKRGQDAFLEAQRLTRWHYQWVVLHDFLDRLTGSFTRHVEPLLSHNQGRRFFKWNDVPYMPVEFSAGAFRLGHSMLRPRYDLNDDQRGVPLFDSEPGKPDLRGIRGLPMHHTVQWGRFVQFGDGDPQWSRIFSTKAARDVVELPPDIFGDEEMPSLIERDLMRAWRLRVPSGQAIAKAIGDPRSETRGSDSLWYYVLREANTLGRGTHLGPVGTTIVAEVLVGLLEADTSSYLFAQPNWTPSLGSRGTDFDLAEFLRFARMPMTPGELPWKRQPDEPSPNPAPRKGRAPSRR